jgi:exopolyphosphatase/guanosine-5'-triphosphate,3'-diphosphate pyrophosphatase
VRAVRVAVVDVGTNSTRLLIADVAPEAGAVTELRRESVVTRLGSGVDSTGRLDRAARERVLSVLDGYAAQIRDHGCEAGAAALTSAVRDAADGAAFAAAVGERLGVEARTLSGDEEAAFTYAGATALRPPGDPTELVVIDIGGGSTELVCGARGRIGFHVSTQIGVVRHSERHLHSDPPAGLELAALCADVDATLADAVPAAARATPQVAIAVAGTATSCAAIELALEPYDAARVEGHAIARAQLADQLDRLAALPLAARRTVAGLHPDRAPTIVAGVAVLIRVLDAFGLDAVVVSDRDILWGVALSLGR